MELRGTAELRTGFKSGLPHLRLDYTIGPAATPAEKKALEAILANREHYGGYQFEIKDDCLHLFAVVPIPFEIPRAAQTPA